MKKFAKILLLILGIIWALVGIFCILAIVAAGDMKDKEMRIIGVCLLAIWLIVTVSVFIIRSKARRKEEWDWKRTYIYKNYYVNSNERIFWDKIPNRLKVTLSIVWLIVGIFFILMIVSSYGTPNDALRNKGIILSAAWLVMSIALLVVIGKIESKTDKRLEEIYDEKYISKLEFEDELFGKMKFRFDSNENELASLELNLPPFGADKPTEICVTDYREEDHEKFFKALRDVYTHKDEILDIVCGEYWETLEEWGEFEEDEGADAEITKEELRGKIAAGSFYVSNGAFGLEITLDIYVSGKDYDFGGHVYEVTINFQNKTISQGIG